MTTKEGTTEGARELARKFFRDGRPMDDGRSQDDQDRLTAAIEARDAALLERAARYRGALEVAANHMEFVLGQRHARPDQRRCTEVAVTARQSWYRSTEGETSMSDADDEREVDELRAWDAQQLHEAIGARDFLRTALAASQTENAARKAELESERSYCGRWKNEADASRRLLHAAETRRDEAVGLLVGAVAAGRDGIGHAGAKDCKHCAHLAICDAFLVSHPATPSAPPLPGHRPDCTSTVPMPYASCCRVAPSAPPETKEDREHG